ncbi:MAG TPA: folylpolyglutamate synthase/dihydrofolate synthase family protein, partial [Chitinophagaceae bacterium]|nr:folylpolyglutamate synthase/dihydrofolate synthase family protein [Chitinophagaceae bacterium]
MFSHIGGAAYKADLNNIIALSETLDNPHKKFKTIHIAGTNGKGSTSHMLAAIFQSSGYKTGLYTSPHLKDFRERIRINGEMIPENIVCDFVEKIKPEIEKIQPSFFEITVAMAFEYFAKEKIEIAIIETGLGGRLDSTNIITPEISVITNIGWDHMNILGNSLEQIATEKAGIIKQGIPVVIGEGNENTRPVFIEKARQENAPITFASEIFHAIEWKYQHHQLVVEVAKNGTDEKHFYQLDLPGVYQAKNLVTVLASVEQMQKKGWKIPDEKIKSALKNVKKQTGFHGRWELVHQHPNVVIDVAHNSDGIAQILRQLELIEPRHLHIVIGVVKDKDVDSVLKLLPKYAKYYFTNAHIPRALDASALQDKASQFGLKGSVFSDVNAATRAAMDNAEETDLVLVCGSVFVVGELNLSW